MIFEFFAYQLLLHSFLVANAGKVTTEARMSLREKRQCCSGFLQTCCPQEGMGCFNTCRARCFPRCRTQHCYPSCINSCADSCGIPIPLQYEPMMAILEPEAQPYAALLYSSSTEITQSQPALGLMQQPQLLQSPQTPISAQAYMLSMQEPGPIPAYQGQPMPQPVPQPAQQHIAQPALRPMPQPVPQPEPQPAPQPMLQPLPQPRSQPVSQSAPQPLQSLAGPTLIPQVDALPPQAQAVTEPTLEPIAQPAPQSMPQSELQPEVHAPQPQSIPQPLPLPLPEPPAEPVPEPVAQPTLTPEAREATVQPQAVPPQSSELQDVAPDQLESFQEGQPQTETALQPQSTQIQLPLAPGTPHLQLQIRVIPGQLLPQTGVQQPQLAVVPAESASNAPMAPSPQEAAMAQQIPSPPLMEMQVPEQLPQVPAQAQVRETVAHLQPMTQAELEAIPQAPSAAAEPIPQGPSSLPSPSPPSMTSQLASSISYAQSDTLAQVPISIPQPPMSQPVQESVYVPHPSMLVQEPISVSQTPQQQPIPEPAIVPQTSPFEAPAQIPSEQQISLQPSSQPTTATCLPFCHQKCQKACPSEVCISMCFKDCENVCKKCCSPVARAAPSVQLFAPDAPMPMTITTTAAPLMTTVPTAPAPSPPSFAPSRATPMYRKLILPVLKMPCGNSEVGCSCKDGYAQCGRMCCLVR